jgi:hypothetical protein
MTDFNIDGLSNSSLTGTSGIDNIRIDNATNVTFDALGGNDRITGFNNSNLTLIGGDGGDTIRLNNTFDSTFIGAAGNDTLIGVGVAGVTLDGRNDNDFLAASGPAGTSGKGNRFIGGPGADTFELPLYDNGRSTAIITDYADGLDKLSIPEQILAGRDLNQFVSTRFTLFQGISITFTSGVNTGQSYTGTGIKFNQNQGFVALLANTSSALIDTSDFVSRSSPIA